MKIPPRTPKLEDFRSKLSDNEFVLRLLSCHEPAGYHHWEKIRYLKPPHDLSNEDWWLAIRLKRSANLKPLPLLDMKGNAFNYQIPDFVQKHLHQVDMNAGGQIAAPSDIINQQTRDQYYLKSIIHEAITSSQLEGAVTTRDVAREMIRTNRKPVDVDEKMILNNYRAMLHINDIKDQRLSPEIVFELHRLLTLDTLEKPDKAGRFRDNNDHVSVFDDEDQQVLHQPPPADELEARLKALCDFANDLDSEPFIHPVIRAIILHFWLAYDHPFIDGNGRTARALFYWSMLRSGYWLFEFISISSIILKAPKQYAKAFLYSEHDNNDLTYFIVHQIDVIQRSIDALHRYLSKKSTDYGRLQQQMGKLSTLNHRQRALILHALKHPYQVYTVESHGMSHNIVPQTSRTDLECLVSIGLLNKSKNGRRFDYNVPRDLEHKIETNSNC